MRICNVVPGNVYHLSKQTGGSQYRNDNGHFYICLSVPDKRGLARCQIMTITSMYNKEVQYELPIVLNNEISYIAPYNIYTCNEGDLTFEAFKGSITDEPYITKNEFITLLIDLWVMYNNPVSLTFDRLNDIKSRYEKYVDSFKKMYPDLPEHRRDQNKGVSPIVPKFNSFEDEIEEDFEDDTSVNFDSWTNKNIIAAYNIITNERVRSSDIMEFFGIKNMNDKLREQLIEEINKQLNIRGLNNVKRKK